MFISFEGGDGCGKSTQIQLLADWLRQKKFDVLTCRDPGSTPLGDAVRTILLNRLDLEICRTSEMLLFMAARAQLVSEVILPALKAGKTVLSDRFLLSTIVYQGYAGQLPIASVEQAGVIATAGILPDLSIVLDISLEESEKRMQNRRMDRMEKMGREYHEKVRQGFLTHARLAPERHIVIDASQNIDAVAVSVQNAIEKFLTQKQISNQ